MITWKLQGTCPRSHSWPLKSLNLHLASGTPELHCLLQGPQPLCPVST